MAYTIEKFDIYSREDVENYFRACDAMMMELAKNQPSLPSKYEFWGDSLKAVGIGETMRFVRQAEMKAGVPHKLELWKILKDGVFSAFALTRAVHQDMNLKDLSVELFPVILFMPLDWSSEDAEIAFEVFTEEWFAKGYTQLWVRMAFGSDLIERQQRKSKRKRKRKVKKDHEYPGPESGANFPPFWSIYLMEP